MFHICWKLNKKYDPDQVVRHGPPLMTIDYVENMVRIERPKTMAEALAHCRRANVIGKRGYHWVSEHQPEEDSCDLPDAFYDDSEGDT